MPHQFPTPHITSTPNWVKVTNWHKMNNKKFCGAICKIQMPPHFFTTKPNNYSPLSDSHFSYVLHEYSDSKIMNLSADAMMSAGLARHASSLEQYRCIVAFTIVTGSTD